MIQRVAVAPWPAAPALMSALNASIAASQWLEEVEDDLNNVVQQQSHLMSQSRHENPLELQRKDLEIMTPFGVSVKVLHGCRQLVP